MEKTLTKEQFLANKAAWKAYAKERKADGADHLLWILIRGADPFKAFSPLQNPRKIENFMVSQGRHKYYALVNICWHLDSRLRGMQQTRRTKNDLVAMTRTYNQKLVDVNPDYYRGFLFLGEELTEKLHEAVALIQTEANNKSKLQEEIIA